MVDLTASKRAAMPQSEFALPGNRFPMNDKVHDRLAIGGATRSEKAGNISASTADNIKAEARAKLGTTSPHPREHSLAMASATHLHKAGYISGATRDQIHAKASHKMDAHLSAKPKPFGALG